MRQPYSPTRSPTPQPRIAVVDEDSVRAEDLAKQLAEAGYRELIAVGNLTSASGFLAVERPDLVLLDLVSSQEKGLELLQTLCRDPRFDCVPILMLTPPEQTGLRAKAVELGVTDFLYAPVDVTELRPRVRNALSLRLLGREGIRPAAGSTTENGDVSRAAIATSREGCGAPGAAEDSCPPPWAAPVLCETSLQELKAAAKVMIVDDQPTIVKVVRKYLSDEGYRNFITTSDATETVELVERQHPDVLLLDIMMPHVSGLEILDAVRSREQFADLPVIILTAATDGAIKQRALDLGATEFLTKPIDPLEVLPRVRNALVLRDRQKQLRTYAKALEREVARHLDQVRKYTETLEKTNDMLRRSRSAARAAEHAKQDFLANMSHEIRTPLTNMIGFAEMMFSDLGSGALAQPDLAGLDTIVRNGKHLLEVFNNVLEFSKIEAGRLRVGVGPCSPADIVADVLRDMRSRAQAKGLLLQAECLTPIPERIQSDANCLRQILLNLTGNAVKYTDRGSVRVALRLLDSPPGQPKLQFEVADTGVGIRSEELAGLLNPFVHNFSAERRNGCTGLGLAICNQLAENLGGSIGAESTPGRGSTFRLTIATGSLEGIALVRRPLDGDRQDSEPKALRMDSSQEQRARRILLAEDCVDNQRLICCMLRNTATQVVTVENGQAAVDAFLAAQNGEQPFDLILMDMQMPVLDGYAATRSLREAGCRIPIIAVTAHAMAGERGRCLAAGCNEYLTKPISRETLVGAVARYLTPAAAT